MKQLTTAKWRTDLSPKAEKKLDEWLKEKDWGSTFDGVFTPLTQLSIGQLIEFLMDHGGSKEYDESYSECLALVKASKDNDSFIYIHYEDVDEEFCDVLSEAVTKILEENN